MVAYLMSFTDHWDDSEHDDLQTRTMRRSDPWTISLIVKRASDYDFFNPPHASNAAPHSPQYQCSSTGGRNHDGPHSPL